MRNLHQFYYKNYFSLQDVVVPMKNNPSINVNRHLDYELLLDDTKKKLIEDKIKGLRDQEKNSQEQRKEQIKNEIIELNAQLSVNADVLKEKNNTLIAKGYSKEILENCNPPRIYKEIEEQTQSIELEIQYPGLVTGIGIDHEAKIEGEFKLGVHFEWTYGMPVIYGSSVKGVLRSALIAKTEKGKIVEYDDYFLKQATGRNWSQEEMEILFNDIFNGKKFVKEVEDDGKKKREYQNKSIYERDIFFDAVITAPDKEGRILCSDSITPHGDNPLKNPTPLTFLKIAPGCKLGFRFKLEDTKGLSGKVVFSKEEKRVLFTKILTTIGIGAKTNVGYGQLEEVK